MIREQITYKDFFRIAKENDIFLWHFLQKKQHKNTLGMWSIFENEKENNPLSIILNELEIPYYESYVEDNIDFLNGLTIPFNFLFENNSQIENNFRFKPLIIGFKKFTKVTSTLDFCYCTEGVINICNKLDNNLLQQIMNKL
jgi:hypothetical protein